MPPLLRSVILLDESNRLASNELQELGEEEDDFTKSTSKLRQEIQAVTGFDIMKNDKEYKDIYDIVVGIGEKWQDLTDIQRAALGEKIAGKNQSNGFFAVMSNIQTLKDAYQTALTSDGSAQKAQDVYTTTIQYSIDRLKASWQELSNDFMSSSFLKGLVDFGNGAVGVIDDIATSIGSLNTVIAGGVLADLLKGKITGRGFLKASFADAAKNVGLSDSGGVFKNIAAIFRQGVQKSNLGQEVVDITADQIAKANIQTDVDWEDFLGGFTGKTINIPAEIASQQGLEGGLYQIQEAAEGAARSYNMVAVSAQQAGQAGANAGLTLSSAFSGFTNVLMANPLFTGALAVMAGIEIYRLVDYINKAGERAKAKMDDSVSEYTESNQKIESLNNQLQETRDKIRDINSQGPLTLVQKSELEDLKKTRKELEYQLDVQESINKLKGQEALVNTESAFKTNYGSEKITFSEITDLINDWNNNDALDLEAIYTGFALGDDLRSVLAAYQGMNALIDDATANRKEPDEWIENAQSEAATRIANQLENIQDYIDAFELMGVNNLNSAQKDIYNRATAMRDLILRVTDPAQWKLNKVDDIYNNGNFKSTISNLKTQVSAIVDAASEDTSASSLVSQAQNQLVDSIPIALKSELKGVELTGEDLIEALVHDSIEGSRVVSETIEADLETASERASALITNVQKLQEATLNKNPAESVSYEDYQLVLDTPALYDYAEAFEVVNGAMTVNAEKWREITDAKEESEKADLEEEKKVQQDRLEIQRQNTADLKDRLALMLSQGTVSGEGLQSIYQELRDSEEEEESILRRIKGYDLLMQTLGEATDAYHTFAAAQNAATSGVMFDKASEAYQALYDIFDPDSDTFGMSGDGNPVYQAAIEFVIPESVREQGKEEIQNYLTQMKDYMRTDADGKFTGELDLGGFIEGIQSAADKTGLPVFSIDYLLSEEGTSVREGLAEAMNLHEEAFRSMLGELMQYDIDSIPELAEKFEFDNAVETSSTLIDNLSTIDGIMSDLASGKSLSSSDFAELFNNKKLNKYVEALELVNGELTLNADKVREIQNEDINTQKAVNNTLLAQYQKEYASEKAGTTGRTVEARTSRMTWLSQRMLELNLYNAKLDESTSAYNRWVEGQSTSLSTEMMDNSVAAIQKINEAFTRGSETFGMIGDGNQAYQLAVDYILPEDLDRDDSKTVQNYIESLGDILDKDLNGEIKGIKISGAIKKALDKGLLTQKNGLYDWGSKAISEIAKGMGVSNGIAEALVNYMNAFGNSISAINMASLVSDFQSATDNASTLLDRMTSISTILSGQTPGASLSFDQFMEFYNDPSLQKYIGALEAYNGEIVLNTEKVREMQKAEGEAMIAQNTAEKNDLMKEYGDNLQRINELYAKGGDITDSELSELTGLEAQNELIVAQCNGLDLLSENIRNATGAYQNWLNMKNADNSDKMFDESTEAANEIKAAFTPDKNGLKQTGEGNVQYQAALDFLIPDTVDKNDSSAVEKYWDSIKNIVYRTNDSGDFEGFNIGKFLDYAVDQGMMTKIGNEYQLAGAMSMQEFADGLNMNINLVEAIFGAMDMYENTFAWTDPDQFNGLVNKAEYAAGVINNLHPEMDLKVDFSEFETTEDKVAAIDQEIQKVSDYQATLEVDSREWRQAENLLNYYEVLKRQAETPAILQVDTSNASPQVQYAVDLIGRLFEALAALDEAEANVDVNPEGVEEAKENVESVREEMETLDGQEAMASVGIETTGKTAQEIAASVFGQTGSVLMDLGIGTNNAQSEIDKMNQETVNIDVNLNDEETQSRISDIEQRLNTLATTPVPIEITADAEEAKAALSEIENAEVKPKELKIGGDGSGATQAINFINKSRVDDKQIRITAYNLALESISRLKYELNNIKDKTITITTVYKTYGDRVTSTGPQKVSGTAHVSGIAHALGTAQHSRPYTNKDLTGEAKLHGDWGMTEGKRVLIGELGPEIVVDPKSGRWRTYGDNGAEFAYVPKNAIVFNHLQTRDLLEKGYVNGRGGALASGTAFANGKQNFTGGINISGSGNTGSSGNSNSGSGKSSSGNSSSNSSSDKDPTKFDWIETMLSRLSRLFDNYKNLADYYTTYTYQNKQLYLAMKQAATNVKQNQAAANEYLTLAKSKVGDSYWKKIVDGTLKIEEISDEKTSKAVTEAKELYEKYLQCTDAVVELRKEILDIAQTKLDNIVDDFDSLQGYASGYIDLLEAEIATRDIKGGSRNIYERNQADIEQLTTMADYYEKLKEAAGDYYMSYNAQITDNIRQGAYVTESQEWVDAMTQLYDLKKQAYEAATSLEELNERIRELNWYSFNEGLEIIEHVDKQLGNTIDLIKDLTSFSDKTGAINQNGISQFNLYSSALANARQEVANYQVAITSLDKELADGIITQDTYNEELRDYREKQMDAVKQVKSYRDAIIDLVKKGIKAETAAMSELISKRKEDLKKQKESNDYAKKVSDKTKEINKIKAQIVALSGDTTAATVAKVRQLQADLAKQEEELAETRADHEYDVRTQALDDELERFKEIQDDKTTELETDLQAQERAIASALSYTTSQYEQTTDQLIQLGEMYGVQLEDFVVNPWKNATAAMDEYKRALETLPTANVSIDTGNAVHNQAYTWKTGGNTLNESGTDGGSSNDPYGKGGPNFTTADVTKAQKLAQDLATAKTGKDKANQAYHVKSEGGVWFRKDPSYNGDMIEKLSYLDNVTTTGNTKQVNGTWWREVKYNGKTGWIHAGYLEAGASDKNTKYTVNNKNGVWFRKEPKQNGTNMIQKLGSGEKVVATGNTKTVDGALWREVKYGNTTGWVMASYLTGNTKTGTTTTGSTSGTTASTTASGDKYKVTAGNGLNLRKTAGNGAVMLTIPKNTQVAATGKTQKVGSTTWREVTYNGKTGWASGSFLEKVATTTSNQEKYKVNATDGLNLRKEAGTGKTILTTIPNNAQVTATGKTQKANNMTWRQVTYNGTTGWVSTDYLKKAARGARYASGLYLTDEEGLGTEAIMTKEGVLRQLDSATVFSKEQTDRLWKLSKSDLLSNVKPTGIGSITMNYGSLLTVQGSVDKDALPGLQELLKQACEYTKRDLSKNLLKMGVQRSF